MSFIARWMRYAKTCQGGLFRLHGVRSSGRFLMPDIHVDRWPHFEMVTFSEPTGIPFGWDKELVSKGVPKDLLGAYNVAHELTLLEVPDYGPLVCFGATGLNQVF